jgi:hypothetical protein
MFGQGGAAKQCEDQAPLIVRLRRDQSVVRGEEYVVHVRVLTLQFALGSLLHQRIDDPREQRK